MVRMPAPVTGRRWRSRFNGVSRIPRSKSMCSFFSLRLYAITEWEHYESIELIGFNTNLFKISLKCWNMVVRAVYSLSKDSHSGSVHLIFSLLLLLEVFLLSLITRVWNRWIANVHVWLNCSFAFSGSCRGHWLSWNSGPERSNRPSCKCFTTWKRLLEWFENGTC